jgi:hypothetical protein
MHPLRLLPYLLTIENLLQHGKKLSDAASQMLSGLASEPGASACSDSGTA